MPTDHDAPGSTSPHRLSRRGLLRLGAAVPLIGAAAAAYGRTKDDAEPAAAAQGTPPAGSPAACPASPAASPDTSPAATPTAAVTVKMTVQLRFDPRDVTIRVGETVTWVSDSPIPHTATGDPEQNPVKTTHPEYVRLPEGAEPWGSELLQQGQSFSHTFIVPGTYEYICIPHVLSDMRGTITVEC